MAKEDSSFGMESHDEFVEMNWEFSFEVGKHTKLKLGTPMIKNLIDEKRRILLGQKELRENFQVVIQEVRSFKKLMIESDSKFFNAIEPLSKKVNRNNDFEYEEFRGRGMNVDFDNNYYNYNINNCNQHVTLHLL
ncbi:hypothetical protein EJD97_018868, partial [Solanum chilense]